MRKWCWWHWLPWTLGLDCHQDYGNLWQGSVRAKETVTLTASALSSHIPKAGVPSGPSLSRFLWFHCTYSHPLPRTSTCP